MLATSPIRAPHPIRRWSSSKSLTSNAHRCPLMRAPGFAWSRLVTVGKRLCPDPGQLGAAFDTKAGGNASACDSPRSRVRSDFAANLLPAVGSAHGIQCSVMPQRLDARRAPAWPGVGRTSTPTRLRTWSARFWVGDAVTCGFVRGGVLFGVLNE